MKQATIKEKATAHAKSCFYNSLLREWPQHFLQETNICIPLVDGQLLLPVQHYSRLGRHQYKDQAFLKEGNNIREISFEESIDVVCTHLMHELSSTPENVAQFKLRVRNSLRNTEAFLSARCDFSRFEENFLQGEQGLLIGHNFHPTPKSRDQFNSEDMYKYSPELKGQFEIAWLWLDSNLLYQHASSTFGPRSWTTELAQNEKCMPSSNKNFVPVPMHPWQKNTLFERSDIQAYVHEGLIQEGGTTGKVWHPTSSLRSIYREDAAYMLKFSLSVRLTNSVRHLLLNEVKRGQQLHDVLATSYGQEFLSRYPTFRVIAEPAFFAIKDPQGKPIAESMVVCRENPFQGDSGRNKVVLATLAQDHPFDELNLIQRSILNSRINAHCSLHERAKRWFDAYLKTTAIPILKAYSDYGIVFGAHQQNLILDLDEGYPVGAFFRDCQGTGYTELGWSQFSNQVSLLDKDNGNILDKSMSHWLLSYYLILNSTFNVITALAQNNWIHEEELLAELKHCLEQQVAEDVRDDSFLKYLLSENNGLMHKGNFLCSFKSLNENTMVNPLDIYTPVPNPFVALHRRLHA